MPDDTNDNHLAPAPTEEPAPEPRGLRSLVRFGRDMGRFVRLAERQGTRLVDILERWVRATEDHNVQVARMATATERLAGHADGYLADDTEADGPWCDYCNTTEHDVDDCTEVHGGES